MAGLKEIKELGKTGNAKEAYRLAKEDLEQGQPWGQLTTGWALRYLIEEDARNGHYDQIIAHWDELSSLNELPSTELDRILENAIFWIGYFAKKNLTPTGFDTPIKLSMLFSKLKDYQFSSGKGYSMLLEGFMRCDSWPEMADFLDWWNLDNLTPDDYKPFVNQKGQKMMTLAERAFIANSKALLRLNDTGRIEEFLPKMDTLMNKHEEMMYPGYFYGKLLLKLGSNADEALKVIIPFARKKQTEFWVWQLLSDVFTNDEEKQLACLLRAVHCHTQESFLGKVRIKLATLYIKRKQFNFARYHIDSVTRCYASQGWRLPDEIECWIHQPWFNSTTPDGNDQIDYMSITDAILCDGAEECIAVVTYVDLTSHKSSMIYGYEKRVVQKIRFKVQAGNILKLHYITDKDGKIRVLSSTKVQLPNECNYAKNVEGTIDKRDDKEFAFLKAGSVRCFVAPTIVKKYNLKNGDKIRSLIVYDYDKKKESWNWVCVNIKK